MPPKAEEQRPNLPTTVALMGLLQLAAPARDGQSDTGAPWVETPWGQRRQSHTFVANTAQPNRYRDIIDQATWQLENYRRNPVILWMHDWDDQPIGRGEVWIDGEGTPDARLMVRVSYDLAREAAADICRQVEEGYLSAVSIYANFGACTWRCELPEADPRYHAGWGRVLSYGDLYEISIVTVAGDANALKQALAAAQGDAHTPPPATPASQPTPGESMLRALILAALALPDATTDEQIAATVTDTKNRADKAEGAARKALGLAAADPLPDDVEARLVAAANPAGMISLVEASRLAAEARASAATDPKVAATAAVKDAVKAGKLLPSLEGHFLSWAEKDAAACTAALAGLVPAVPLTAQASPATAPTSKAPTERERSVSAAFRLTDEQIARARAKNNLINGRDVSADKED